jgi:hypothetical protein
MGGDGVVMHPARIREEDAAEAAASEDDHRYPNIGRSGSLHRPPILEHRRVAAADGHSIRPCSGTFRMELDQYSYCPFRQQIPFFAS